MIPLSSSRMPRHPGRVLVEDFLSRLPGVTQAHVADRLGISRPRLNEIVNGARGVTPDTALRLARAFGTTPEFWMGAQAAWDLYDAARSRKRMREIERMTPLVDLSGDASPPPAAASCRGGTPAVDIRTEIGVLAARFAAPAEGPTVERYEEFLRRKGLLNEARRFARIPAQFDALAEGRRGGDAGASERLSRLLATAPALTFTD